MSIASPARPTAGGRAGLRSAQSAPYRAAAFVAIAVAADEVFEPTSNHVPLCPLHALTGIWCPFCGGLRSAYQLTRLHLRSALHYNAVFVLALPVLLALWIDWAVRARSGQPRRALSRRLSIAIVVLLVVFTVVRNLPFAAGLRGA